MSTNDNTAQKNSDAFRLPVLDRDFLLGDSMRGVRLQLEIREGGRGASRLGRPLDYRRFRQRTCVAARQPGSS